MNVLAAFKEIRAFVFDVDGVLTDSTILVLGNGEQARRMSIKDGYALQLAVKMNYKVIVISGAEVSSVKDRLQRLGIADIHFGVKSKSALLLQISKEYNIQASSILYMGDDIPDLEALKWCGLASCPADAVQEVKSISTYISPFTGGAGCVRDVIEKTLKLNNHWLQDTSIPSK
jgi:3-deoxy-D-manno-octulosonate 8-phosphate phosphatase (KDO 8-P phosphatase)